MNFSTPYLFTVLSLCLLPAVAVSATAETNRPNIILCVTDNQGWGDTSYNAHPKLKTPNLDAMAAAGKAVRG